MDQASIPVFDQGFQYGYGFFETLRVERGTPQYLKKHIDRFYKTWKYLFAEETPDPTRHDIIRKVIAKNGLLKQTAALKIITTKGNREAPPFNHALMAIARPYRHRLAEKKEEGLHLATYPKPHQSPLAEHKTLHYLYYFLAGKLATAQGADKALIMNPDGTISETNTANILLLKAETILRPVSPHVLPGIMEKMVCDFLVKQVYLIETKEIRSKDLFFVDEVFVTNSLIGALPVLTIDHKKTGSTSDLWRKINEAMF